MSVVERAQRQQRRGGGRTLIESVGASALLQLSLLVSGIVAARALGPRGRGDLALDLLLPGVACQMACFGAPSATTYFVAKYPSEWTRVARDIALLVAGQMVVAGGLLAGLQWCFGTRAAPSTQATNYLMLGAVPLIMVQYYGLAIAQGLGEMRVFNILRIAAPMFYAGALIGAAQLEVTVPVVAAGWLTAQAGAVGCLIVALRSLSRGRAESSQVRTAPTWRTIVRFGARGFLAQVSPLETFRIDQLLVAALYSRQVLGFYAVGLSVSNVPRFLADGIVAVAYPRVAAQVVDQGRVATGVYLRITIIACTVVTLILGGALPWLVPIMFGARYDPSVTIGEVVLLAACLISVRRVGTDCLRALGNPGTTTVIEVITLGLLAVVILGALYVPFAHGLLTLNYGVAIALSVAASVGLVLTLGRLRHAGAR